MPLLHGEDLLPRLGEFLPEEHRNYQVHAQIRIWQWQPLLAPPHTHTTLNQ